MMTKLEFEDGKVFKLERVEVTGNIGRAAWILYDYINRKHYLYDYCIVESNSIFVRLPPHNTVLACQLMAGMCDIVKTLGLLISVGDYTVDNQHYIFKLAPEYS